MFDLNLCKKPDKKVQVSLYLYETTQKELQEICEHEDVKVSYLMRHLINVFISEWRKKNEKA